MSGLIDKRKRSREEDVLCESTPLSKRINNLHLSNYEDAIYNQQLHALIHHNTNNHITKENTSLGENPDHKHAGSFDSDKNLYEPELSEAQNPYYYLKNKLLHDLHLERLKRSSV